MGKIMSCGCARNDEVCIDPNLDICAGRKRSCDGFFAYVCTEKLAFVDYLRTAQKIHWYRIGVCA